MDGLARLHGLHCCTRRLDRFDGLARLARLDRLDRLIH